ncbi:glycosyltransferase family 39 protein [Pseudomonas sp. LB1P83]
MSFEYIRNITSIALKSKWARSVWLLMMLVMLLAVGVRFYGLSAPYFWGDEAFSLRLSSLSLTDIWFYAGRDVHPPLYYYGLHFWVDIFGGGEYATRSLSVFFGVATVLASMRLVSIVTNTKDALLCGFFMALLPIAVRYSQEARMYSLLWFLLIATLIPLVKWVEQPSQKRHVVVYVLLMSLAMYTHYFAMLALLSHWVYLGVLNWKRRGECKYLTHPVWVIGNVALFVLYLPWLLSLAKLIINMKLVGSNGAFWWIPGISFNSFPSIIWEFFILHKGRDLNLFVYCLIPFAIVVGAIYGVKCDRGAHKFSVLIVSYTFFPLLMAAIVSIAVPIWNVRYLGFSSIGVPIILAIALGHTRWCYRVTIIGLLAVLQVVGLLNVYSQSDDLNFSRDKRRFPFETVLETVRERAVSGDRIIVEGGIWYYSVDFYNKSGIQPLLHEVQWKENPRVESYGFLSLLSSARNSVFVDDMEKLPFGTSRVWWISVPGVSDVSSFPTVWRERYVQSAGLIKLRLFDIGS